jgi:hypothetical protein
VKAFVGTVAIAVLALVGCGDDGGSETEETVGDGDEAVLSSYEDIASLNDDLAAGGIECALEYEGLTDDTKEISQCTIEGSQAILTVWYDTSLLEEIVAPPEGEPPPGVAYGENWSVELTSGDEAVARSIAEAAGGTAT